MRIKPYRQQNIVNLLILLLFAALTLVYFRHVFASGAEELLTKHLATDLYGHFVHVHERLGWFEKGFLPLGDYWVPRGGGFPAAVNDQFIIPQEFLLMVFYNITGSLTLSLKILYPLFYFLGLITSFWYGITVFKRKAASVIFAVSYGFCLFGTNQWEHLELIGVAFLIMLSLIFLEKTFRRPKPLYICLTSLFLFLVLISNLYAFAFTALYILFRSIYQLITERTQTVATMKKLALIGVLFAFVATPYILASLGSLGGAATTEFLRESVFNYSQPPYMYFLRDVPFIPYDTEIYFMYLGISVIVLALLPIFLKHSRHLFRLYIFNLLVGLFFLIYTVGQHSPLNIALLLHDYVPFFSAIRVPGRALIIGYFNVAACAAIGYLIISNMLRHRFRGIIHSWRFKALSVGIPIIIIAVIFVDLTVGFEPTTMPMLKDNEAYNYLREQKDDGRVIEIPSIHDQQALTAIYTGHDVLNPTLWAFSRFKPLEAFRELFYDYSRLGEYPLGNNLDHLLCQTAITYSLDHKDTTLPDGAEEYGTREVPGVSGSALAFNGVDSYIKIPQNDDNYLSTKAVITFWLKLPSEEATVPQGWIIGKGGGWNRPGWAVTTQNKNHIRFQWQSGDDIVLDSAAALSYEEWHYVAVVNDGNSLSIIIDGQPDQNVRSINSINAASMSPLMIGQADNGNLPLNGTLDEIQIYDYDLEAMTVFKVDSREIAAKAAFYGVEYILINSDPVYHDQISSIYHFTEVNIEKTLNIKKLLSFSEEHVPIFDEDNISIFRNQRYRGKVFAVPALGFDPSTPYDMSTAKAIVTYQQKNPDTLSIYVDNAEPISLIVSQSYADGWRAEIRSELSDGQVVTGEVPVFETASIQYLYLEDTGQHTINLHFTRHSSSLFTYLAFNIPLLIIAVGLLWGGLGQRRAIWKHVIWPILLVYGILLTGFSLCMYPRIFPGEVTVYHLAVTGLGVMLIISPLTAYLFLVLRSKISHTKIKSNMGDN